MGGEKCWRCGLRRFETDVKCFGCGAPLGPAATADGRTTAGTARARLDLAVRPAGEEPPAPPGRLFNIARYYLGVPSAFLLLLWAYALLLFGVTFRAPLFLVYSFPFIVYPAVSLYCCLRVLPARRVATLGILAHLNMLFCAAFASYVYGEPAVGNNAGSAFGWVVTLGFVAAWVTLYAGRLLDEGRLRADVTMQTALGLALILLTVAALGLSRASDRRARDRELEQLQQQWSNRP